MTTTMDTIRSWLEEGIKNNATHVIIVTDTFSYDDFPVHVEPERDVRKVISEMTHASMQKIQEVYDLSIDLESQLKQTRVYNI